MKERNDDDKGTTMLEQWESNDVPPLTQVVFFLPSNKVLSFVTAQGYGLTVKKILGTIREFTNSAIGGQITWVEVVRRIVSSTPHFPVLGGEFDHNRYVDWVKGDTIHVDYPARVVYIGKHRRKDTYGRVRFGGRIKDVCWDEGAEEHGPTTLNETLCEATTSNLLPPYRA